MTAPLPIGFDAACAHLRPELHRFCRRMMGNPWDGEDVVQDALVAAYARAHELRDAAAVRGWLFRIAHNKCIDALRVARRFEPLADSAATERDAVATALDAGARAHRTLAHIVTRLPPRERACVVLKDALDYSLEETAELTGSTVGAVKAALHRAREKLATADEAAQATTPPATTHHRAIVDRYLALFNRRDWDGVRALLADDARLEVVDRAEGPFADACYFVNHERLAWPWRLILARVDGELAIVRHREVAGAWQPHSIVLLAIRDDRVALVRDYMHVDGLLAEALVESVTV